MEKRLIQPKAVPIGHTVLHSARPDFTDATAVIARIIIAVTVLIIDAVTSTAPGAPTIDDNKLTAGLNSAVQIRLKAEKGSITDGRIISPPITLRSVTARKAYRTLLYGAAYR